MKKLLGFVLNITVIISLLIPSNTALGSTTGEEPFPLSSLSSTGLFRTTITIEQPYDLTRLEKLDLTVLAQYGDQIEVITHVGHDERWDEQHITNAPGLVVGDLVKFVGVAPDYECFVGALRAAGLE